MIQAGEDHGLLSEAVERPRSCSGGISWARMGIDRPLGLRSLLGPKAADPGEVSRSRVCTCWGTRSPVAVQNWFNFWFVFPTHPIRTSKSCELAPFAGDVAYNGNVRHIA